MRSVRAAGFLVLVAGAAGTGALAAAPPAGAQPPGQLSCLGSAPSTPGVPAEGEADLLGDLVLTCTGGNATVAGALVPTVNITIFFNTNETSRVLAASVGGPTLTDAMLIVDDPAPANQLPCDTTTVNSPTYLCTIDGTGGNGTTYNGSPGHQNIFYGYEGTPQSPSEPNALTFYGVPFDPPGNEGQPLTLRFANLRANATMLPASKGSVEAVESSISINGATSVGIINGQQVLGLSETSLGLSLLDAAGTGPLGTPPVLDACQASSADAVLAPAEAFAGAFATRTTAGTGTANQDVPATAYGTESGFVNTAFPSPLGDAGLADFGARLVLSFTGPAGAAVTLPTVANLDATGVSGATGTLQMVTDPAQPYNPVKGTSVTLTVGAQPASVAYEVVATTTGAIETADVPVTVSAPAGTPVGAVTVDAGYGPEETSAAEQLPTSGPIPRFGPPLAAQTLASVEGCTTVSASGSQEYGSDQASLSYTTNPTDAVLAGTLACRTVDGGTPIAAGLPAGTHTIDGASCSGLTAQGSGVSISGAADGFDVTPAPLSITASSGSMTYGSAPPAVTPSYRGLVAGDTAASLATQPTCSTIATSASVVGSYQTTCQGAVDGNYDISYLAGAMTVVPDATDTTVRPNSDPTDSGAALTFVATVRAATPGSGTPTGGVTFTLTGAAGRAVTTRCNGSGDTVGLVDGSAACAVAPGVLLGDGGPYRMTVAYAGNGNFTGSEGSAVAHIVDAAVEVIASVLDSTPDVGAGDTIDLVATVERESSTGPGRVVVTDVLPAGVAYHSASAGTGSVTVSGRTVTWVLTGLKPGSSAALSIMVTVRTTDRTTDDATFTQAVPTAGGATTGASNAVTVTPRYAVLVIEELAQASQLAQGSADSFVETVTSKGPDAARDVVVTSPVPSGVNVTSITVSQGTASEAVAGGVETVTWDLGTLAAGAGATMRLEVTVTASPGTVVDEGQVDDVTFDPSGQQHVSWASVIVTAPAVVPGTHTGEPWSGWPYWALVTLIGLLGTAAIGKGRRRRTAVEALR